MPDSIKGRVSFRTVVVRLPGGGTQYWFTDRSFSAGDKITRGGASSWVVDDVLEPPHEATSTTVTLREEVQATHPRDPGGT